MQGALGQGGGRGVLHAAEDEVGDAHLRVFGPRVGRAGEPLEQRDHLGGALEGALAVGLPAPGDMVREPHPAALFVPARELAGHDADEVGAVGQLLRPLKSAAVAPDVGHVDQAAIGDGLPAFGDLDLHRAGRLLVRGIQTGQPVAGVVVLALRPNLLRPLGVRGVGREEEQSEARAHAVVANGQAQLLAGFGRRGEWHAQAVGAVLEGDWLTVQLDGGDLQLGSVQGDGVERLIDHLQPQLDLSVEAALLGPEAKQKPHVAGAQPGVTGGMGGAIAEVEARESIGVAAGLVSH